MLLMCTSCWGWWNLSICKYFDNLLCETLADLKSVETFRTTNPHNESEQRIRTVSLCIQWRFHREIVFDCGSNAIYWIHFSEVSIIEISSVIFHLHIKWICWAFYKHWAIICDKYIVDGRAFPSCMKLVKYFELVTLVWLWNITNVWL